VERSDVLFQMEATLVTSDSLYAPAVLLTMVS
jgi:hypothetical protein